MKYLATIAAVAAVLTVAVIAIIPYGNAKAGPASGTHSFWTYVSRNGDIKRPSDQLVRDNWVHLGTWAIPQVKGASGAGMHDVYTERWVVDAFNKTHQWPDGAVLVKQVHAINKGSRTTGPEVYWEGDTAVWFVMVKDNQNRFPKDARWGEGWGWALFTAAHPDTNISTNRKGDGLSNCFGCHIPAKSTGWVYLEGYPPLHLTADQKKAAAAR